MNFKTFINKNAFPIASLIFILTILTSSSLTLSPENVGCEVYDDFIRDIFDFNKWEIRQDVEGQPHIDEYWLDAGQDNYHMQQNTLADRRTYLFPKRTFTTGDIITYETDLISREGTYAQMTLLTGSQYYRLGLRGPAAGFDELGVSKVRIEFEQNNLAIRRVTPSGGVLIDNLPLTVADGIYELYIGGFSGHDGKFHMDFDKFRICDLPEELGYL